MKLHQVYAFVTAEGWNNSLHERWPHAPLIGNYRLLVFTNEDLPRLKQEYEGAVFKELTQQQTIEAMNAGNIGPFICNLTTTKGISLHFNPPQPDTNQESNHVI